MNLWQCWVRLRRDEKELAVLYYCKLFFTLTCLFVFRLNAQAAEEIKMKMPLSSAEDSTKVRRGGKSGKNGQIKHNLITPK